MCIGAIDPLRARCRREHITVHAHAFASVQARANKGIAPLADSLRSYASFAKALARPIKKPPENFADVVKLWERGKITFAEALEQTGLKQATFYNRLREFRNGKKK